MKRTYSRRGLQRRSKTSGTAVDGSSGSEQEEFVPLSKRQKREVDGALPSVSPRASSYGKQLVENGRGQRRNGRSPGRRFATPPESSPQPSITKRAKTGVSHTSSTPIQSFTSLHTSSTPSPRALSRSHTMPVSETDGRHVSLSPTKQARNLSNLFNFITTDGAGEAQLKEVPSVAKRMLRRTGTDSSTSSSNGGSSVGIRAFQARSTPTTPRKLEKTRSDSVIDLTGSPSARGQSLSPSKSQSLEEISSPAVQPSSRPSLASSNIRTYAGTSRSFLVALPAAQFGSLSRDNSQSQPQEDENDILINSQEDEFESRESYTDLRTRWGVDNSEDDPRPPSPAHASPADGAKRKGKGKQPDVQAVTLPNGMMNDLKSITELRSKGESRRFLDEVGYLFEGLDADAVLSVRRGSALEIVTKLCDVDFARRAKATDFLGRAWEALRETGAGDGDKVLDAVLIFFAALVSKETRDIEELAAKSDFLPVMYCMLSNLERSNDPLWLISSSLGDPDLRKAGIPKAEKTLLTGLEKLVRKRSGLLESGDIVSNRMLISLALAALSPMSQNASHLSSLLKSLTREIDPISSRIEAYTSGLPMLPPLSSATYLDAPSFLYVDNCLRLLDSFILGRWVQLDYQNCDSKLEAQREQGLASTLVGLCAACDVISRDVEYHDQHAIARKCMESALRVLITLTHDDSLWCQAVLSEQLALPTIIRLIMMSHRQRVEAGGIVKHEPDANPYDGEDDDGDDAVPSFDRLCLALGLLTNLIQVSHEAKDLTRLTMFDINCAGKRSCMRACRCAARISALKCLAVIYVEHSNTENEVDSVVRGHMAVLLGMLMQECRDNQAVLLEALPGSSDKHKLDALVEHARDFASFYAEFTKRVSAMAKSQSQVEEENEVADGADSWRPDRDVGRLLRDGQGRRLRETWCHSLKD